MGPLVVPLITGAISLFSSLFGAHKQASSANTTAKLQADAQAKSDLIRQKAADDALAETKREADMAAASNEAARKGNWQMDAARQRRIGTIGEMVGLGPREIPAYVPDPSVAGQAGAGASHANVPARPADLTQALQVANQTAYGYDKHIDPTYWQALWQKDPEYAFRRMLGEQAGPQDAAKMGPYAGQAAAAPKPQASPYAAGSIGAMAAPVRRAPLTPALRAPLPYEAGY